MTTPAAQKSVADLTVGELKELIRETVMEAISELLIDPDEGLELREEFVAEMVRRLASDEPMIPAEEVFRRNGLD